MTSEPDGAPAPGRIRTVLGDIDAADLGSCDYHEHLFQTSPVLAGEELDDAERSAREAQIMADAGLSAMVEATPTGLGRRPDAVARIAAATGLTIVHVTGSHHEGHYAEAHPLRALGADELARRFTGEVRRGLRDHDGASGEVVAAATGEPVRAGMVKAGVGLWRISTFERQALEAAAVTAQSTGVAVMVHLEYGSAAWEVLALLESAGLPPHRVVLAHMDRNPDPVLHTELAAAGAYLGYDGMARFQYHPESVLIDCLAATADAGGAPRILMGGDVARRSRFESYGGMPGLRYLPARFLPRVRSELGADLVSQITVDNPARLLAASPR